MKEMYISAILRVQWDYNSEFVLELLNHYKLFNLPEYFCAAICGL